MHLTVEIKRLERHDVGVVSKLLVAIVGVLFVVERVGHELAGYELPVAFPVESFGPGQLKVILIHVLLYVEAIDLLEFVLSLLHGGRVALLALGQEAQQLQSTYRWINF